MTKLQVSLSLLYWAIAAPVLWLGYIGDSAIDAASTTRVTHSAAFDVFAMFLVIAVAYAAIGGVWWAIAAWRRRAARPPI
jgi:hypothetical protein